MPATYEPIASIRLGAAISSVIFNSIPQTHTDLICVINGSTVADANIGITYNLDTGNNYSMTAIYGNGSTTVSVRNSNTNNIGIGGISSGSQEQGCNIIQIFNYSNTTTHKTLIARANNSTFVQLRCGLWRSTSAITSITLVSDGTTFVTGTTFSLYGIKAA